MARPYMTQASPVVAPLPDPPDWKQPAISETTGLQACWETCPKCGEPFMVVQKAHFVGRSGECKCVERERQAREILKMRGDVISAAVDAKLAATAPERAERVNVQLLRLMDAERKRIAGEVLWEDEQRFRADAEREELAKIVDELKSTGA